MKNKFYLEDGSLITSGTILKIKFAGYFEVKEAINGRFGKIAEVKSIKIENKQAAGLVVYEDFLSQRDLQELLDNKRLRVYN